MGRLSGERLRVKIITALAAVQVVAYALFAVFGSHDVSDGVFFWMMAAVTAGLTVWGLFILERLGGDGGKDAP